MFCSSLILVAILDSWNPSRSPSWTLFWPALCGPFLPASCRPRVGQWLRCDQWKQPTSTPIFGVLGAPLYLNIHFCQGKPYMNLYGMFTVKTVFFFPFCYFLPVNWPKDSTIFAPSRSWDQSATTLFVGCNLSYPYTLWIPTYFPRMVAQQPWALITIVE